MCSAFEEETRFPPQLHLQRIPGQLSGVLGLGSTLPVFCCVIFSKQVTLFEPVFPLWKIKGLDPTM